MPATVRPCDGYVAARPVRPSAVSPNGIFTPERLEKEPTFGRIIAVGQGREYITTEGCVVRQSMPFEAGQVIRMAEAAIVRPEGPGGPEYVVVDTRAILAVIDGFVEHDEKGANLSMAMDKPHNNGAGLLVPPHVAGRLGKR